MSHRAVIGALVLTTALAACRNAPAPATSRTEWLGSGIGRLPTGRSLDPAGTSVVIGAMPLGAVLAPGGRRVVVSLSGWREQGIQVVDRASGRVMQSIPQASAFVGLAFSPDGQFLSVSGGNEDVVYRYRWTADTAALMDSVILGAKTQAGRTRYPAGLGFSPDGRTLYVAENLGDALAVVDVATGRVKQRRPIGRYPYGVVVAPDGQVFVSAWTGGDVMAFRPQRDGLLDDGTPIPVARHPSTMLTNRNGSRLFVASASTDRVTVVDVRTRQVLTQLLDAPAGTGQGSTPNALALSADERTLYVAEADNNAVAVFTLGDATSGHDGTSARDSLVGRIPVGWYPTSVLSAGDTLLVMNGKGMGTRANPDGPSPSHPRTPDSHSYTLGQLDGTLLTLAGVPSATPEALASLSRRVARANGWDRTDAHRSGYPPFEHVVYVIKENRTYDQVLGDLRQADGDTTLLFFPRSVSPNHHALAERFGIFDRFFVNAEVSPDGHNWSTAAYATDYLEKTVPSEYSSRGRSYDYEGTNRGFNAANIPDDDAAEPASGYLWDVTTRARISLRNYGEFVVRDDRGAATPSGGGAAGSPSRAHAYRGTKTALLETTNAAYPGFDLDIRDQVRADVWLADFAEDVRRCSMPALEIVRLPNDHTAGARAGSPTPRAYMADNDLALGRMVEAVSQSPFWRNTVFFVLEDDAQNGPDHVDSHRSLLLVISAYNRAGAVHRWVNTTDVIATMLEILRAPNLTQFDAYARPLREIWAPTADLAPYPRLLPAVDSSERIPRAGQGARDSRNLELSSEDAANETLFNHVLWRAIKGSLPYPDLHRVTPVERKVAR